MTAPMGDQLSVAIVVTERGSAAAVQSIRGVGQAVESVAGQAAGAGSALPSFYEGAEQAGLKAGGAERGIRRMEFALSSVGAAALFSKNATETVADSMLRVGEAALLFAGGSQAALGFGAGLASFALVWKGITAEIGAADTQAVKLGSELNRVAAEGRPLVAQWERMAALIQQNQETADRLIHPGAMSQVVGFAQAFLPWRTQATEEVEAGQITDLSNVATEQTMAALMGRDKPTTTARDAVTHYRGLIAQRGAQGNIPGALGELSNATDFLNTVTGLSPDVLAASKVQLGEELARVVSEGIKTAGQNLQTGLATRDARLGVLALQSLGLGPEDFARLKGTVSEALGGVIEEEQKAFGPGALSPVARVRERGLGIGLSSQRFQAPTPAPIFGERAATNLVTTTDVTGGIRQNTATGVSAVGNLKALDEGAKAAAKFAEATDKAATKVQEAGEKFSITLTRSIGDAVLMITRGHSVSGLAAGASSVLGTISQERSVDAKGNVTFPHQNLALPATILSVAAPLLSGITSLFNSGFSIKDYGPVALEQLRALMVQGGLVSMNITASGGRSTAELSNAINRQTARDSIPRFPQPNVGAGR